MTHSFRHSICNEIYRRSPFAEACRSARQAGYTGIEIAPFTLATDATTIPPAERREVRSIVQSEGLEFVGLHWLMLGPQGLHVTTPDRAVRERSWEYVRGLIDLCADFGGGVMVFGSPKQRGATGGLSVAGATLNFADGLAILAPHALERNVTVLIEALSPDQTGVVTSLGEAVALVREIGSPAIRTMFDCHNAVAEREPHAVLVERHFDLIRHVHLNEMDGRHPGTGSYNFKPVLEVLARRGYAGWLSLEAFDFMPGADAIAGESLRYMEAQIAQLT
jgi:D-psicose/D-tagatose/L-ribulose 3-epimerase